MLAEIIPKNAIGRNVMKRATLTKNAMAVISVSGINGMTVMQKYNATNEMTQIGNSHRLGIVKSFLAAMMPRMNGTPHPEELCLNTIMGNSSNV